VMWTDKSGATRDAGIAEFKGGVGREWFFYRAARSRHNVSAPDFRIIAE
jgi:hypothetical protein